MKIKALTLWQPWASFMAIGLKKNETRSWSTSYRGPLAIHAATKIPKTYPGDIGRLAINQFGYPAGWPVGKILCVVNLWSISPMGAMLIQGVERILGDYSPNRWVWATTMLHVFDEPIPCKGHQGLWDWEWNK